MSVPDSLRKPTTGMHDLKRQVEDLAAHIDELRGQLDRVTQNAPERAGETAIRILSNASVNGVAGPINSAISCALDSLRDAASDVRMIYAEAKRVGLPDGAGW